MRFGKAVRLPVRGRRNRLAVHSLTPQRPLWDNVESKGTRGFDRGVP